MSIPLLSHASYMPCPTHSLDVPYYFLVKVKFVNLPIIHFAPTCYKKINYMKILFIFVRFLKKKTDSARHFISLPLYFLGFHLSDYNWRYVSRRVCREVDALSGFHENVISAATL
jgi:hypothetical protein